jgi:hypothetical protein
MLVLLTQSFRSIALYINFNRESPETILLDRDGAAVLDSFNDTIKGQGGWKDPKNVTQFLFVVTTVHEVRNHPGPFLDLCEECINADQNGNYYGCTVSQKWFRCFVLLE